MFRFLNIRDSYEFTGLVEYIAGEETMEAFLDESPLRPGEYLIYDGS